MRTGRPLLGAILGGLLFAPSASRAPVLLTRDEALKLAFPTGTSLERRTAFLTPAEEERVARLSGGAPPHALVIYYAGLRGGRTIGTAYLDTHVVRTQPETLLVRIDPPGTIGRIEVLSFLEPEEYLPRSGWYGQFEGKRLDEELSETRGIRPVTGATLTVRATLQAARRVLALHQVLGERSSPP